MTHNKTWLYIEMNIKITIKTIVIHRIYTSYTQKLSTGYSYPQQYAYLSTGIERSLFLFSPGKMTRFEQAGILGNL